MAGTLTERQQARHARVIEATIELAREGGYEAVQMRDVAAQAQVALGTLYRYFSSKDHLLVAVLADWAEQMRDRLKQRPPRAGTAAERVIDALKRATRSLEREPRLASALVTALSTLSSEDARALEEAQEIYGTVADIITTAADDGSGIEHRDEVIRTISLLWLTTLLTWVRGWQPISQTYEDLDSAVRLLIHQ